MATKTVRTPTKVRANREAVIEYFDAMKQEPVKDGSTLQQTPSGLHFKLPTKRLVYESDHYAVFDNEESASSQSDDASFHSLRGQESIEAPQGFYYGTENESQRYHGGREHQQQHQARVYKIGDIQTHNAQQVTTEILHSLHSRIRGIVECQEHPKLTTIEEVHAKSQPLRFVRQMKS